MKIESPEDLPLELAALREVVESISEWEGQKPDKEKITQLTHKVAEFIPDGWEFQFRMDSDPEIALGFDLEVKIAPFDQALHNRDISEMKAGWLWRFYRGESKSRIKAYSKNNQSSIASQKSSPNLDYFEEGLEDFRKDGLSVLDKPNGEAKAVFIHLRKAKST